MSNLIFKFKFIFCQLLLATNYGVFGQNRILSGTEADITQFPFLVELSLHGANNHAICGAAIISKDWVVSAAHCFLEIKDDPTKIKYFLIISGTTYTREMISQDKKPPKYHNITEYHVHEQFKGKDKLDGYDISVLKVTPPFEFDDVTQAAKLPKSKQVIKEKHAKIAGWGCTQLRGSTSPKLLYANVTKFECGKVLKNYEDTYINKDSILCYGPPKSDDGKIPNICQGDSGGPLIINNKMVAGVVSLSRTDIKVPGLFTSTAYYRDWIKQKTGV